MYFFRALVIISLLCITVNVNASSIVHIKAAEPVPLLELSGEWVPDAAANKKLMKKARRDMQKKAMANMPKPPAGARPGGGGLGGKGMPGGGMGGAGMPGGEGMRISGMRAGMRDKGMPQMGPGMIEGAAAEDIMFAAPMASHLKMTASIDRILFFKADSSTQEIAINGNSLDLNPHIRVFAAWGSRRLSLEFSMDNGTTISHAYTLEDNQKSLRILTEFRSPNIPTAMHVERLYRRAP
jgi:hypothetical protein